MAEVRRRKVEEAGGDDVSNNSFGASAGTSEADKRNSSAAESSDHVSWRSKKTSLFHPSITHVFPVPHTIEKSLYVNSIYAHFWMIRRGGVNMQKSWTKPTNIQNNILNHKTNEATNQGIENAVKCVFWTFERKFPYVE